MVEWMKGFFIPIIELVFIGGFVIAISFIVWRAFHKVYSTQWKWVLKYTIFRKKYDEKTVKWILEAMENEIDYWSAKRMLLIKGFSTDRINETMWIYDKINNELKGGMNKNGQRIAGSNRKTQSAETTGLPTDFKTY